MDDTRASLLLTRRFANMQIFPQLKNRFRDHLPFIEECLKQIVGRVRAVEILELFRENGIELDEDEIGYIHRRYVDFKGEMSLKDMIESFDILRPIGHNDPDQFIDTLPQPYRMISKLLEQEIIDSAWLQIVRLHPDLEVGSDGQQICVPANRNLEEICTPSVLLKDKPCKIVSQASGPYDYHFMASSSGLLHVSDSSNGKYIKTIPVFPTAGDRDSKINILAVKYSPMKEKSIITVRLILCETYIGMEIPPEDPNAKKKGPDPEPIPTPKCLLSIVDLQIPLNVIESGAEFEINVTLAHTIDHLLSADEPIPSFSADLNADGSILALYPSHDVTADNTPEMIEAEKNASYHGKVYLYVLTRMIDSTGRVLSKVDEKKEFVDDPRCLPISTPSCSIDMKEMMATTTETDQVENTPNFNGVLSCTFHAKQRRSVARSKRPMPKATPEDVDGEEVKKEDNNEDANTAAQASISAAEISSVGLVVLIAGATSFISLGFKKGNATSDDAGGVSNPNLIIAKKEFQAELPAAVSAFAYDSGRCALFLGLCNGLVTCYSLPSLVLTSILGRHEVGVTCISLVSRDTTSRNRMNDSGLDGSGMPPDNAVAGDSIASLGSANSTIITDPITYYVVSGAIDGSMCFFSIHVPKIFNQSNNSIKDNSLRFDSDPKAQFRCLRTQYFALRRDFKAPLVNMWCVGCKSLLIAQAKDSDYGSSGSAAGQVLAVYDVEGGYLLGQLDTAEGMEARNNPARLAVTSDLNGKLPASTVSEGEGEANEIPVADAEANEIPVADAEAEETENPETSEGGGEDNVVSARADKFTSSSFTDIVDAQSTVSCVGTSSSGVSVIYMRQSQGTEEHVPVLAYYSVDRIAFTLCAACKVFDAHPLWTNVPSSTIYSMLTTQERQTKNLSIQAYNFPGLDGSSVLSAEIPMRKDTAHTSNSQGGAGKLGRKSSKGGKTVRGALTAENVAVHEAQYQPIRITPTLPLDILCDNIILSPNVVMRSNLIASATNRDRIKKKINTRFKGIQKILD